MLGLPLAGSYHTELAAYAQLRAGDPRVAIGMQVALSAFYGHCGIVLSPSVAADASLRELGIAAARIGRRDRGVDSARFSPARREPGRFRPDRVNVLYAGRLTREKGADLLADAFLAARARDARLHLVLAGGGAEEASMRTRLGRAATFLGWLDGVELAAAYASADVFLFCSATDTFGQVVLEAQASGLPVVAVSAGGPAELIADGRRGPRRLARDARPARTRRARGGARADVGGVARAARGGLAPRARAGGRGREGGGMTARVAAGHRERRMSSRYRMAGSRRHSCRRGGGGRDDRHGRERRIAVEPATFERCALIRDWLADHGIDRATLLVIPAPDLHPFFQRRLDLAAWLLDCRDRGDAIAQHGFQHRRHARAGVLRRQNPEAEFARMDPESTQRASTPAGGCCGSPASSRAASSRPPTRTRRRCATSSRSASTGGRRCCGSSAAPAPRARARLGARRVAPHAGHLRRPLLTPVCRAEARGSAGHMKLLVLTPEPVDADMLRSTLGDEVEGAEVLVVSPATNQSKLAFWVSDPDEAIAEADSAQEETVERLEEAGVDAAGDTGESEPAVALQDALATFPADRILVFSHPEGDRDYREDEGIAEVETRFGIPVTRAVIGR